MVDQRDQVLQRQRLLRARNISSRKLEDVDYWRKQAGWADDDETMKSYNQGVYNTYYNGGDDDNKVVSSGGDGSSNSKSGASIKFPDHLGWIVGLASTLIFLILLVKCCSGDDTIEKRKSRSSAKSRDSSRSLRDKHADRRSRSRSSRSKSRTRSKSRSRGVEDYKLMDEDDNRSRKSSMSGRSRKSGRSRSRSKARSKSRTRERKSEKETDDKMTMLV